MPIGRILLFLYKSGLRARDCGVYPLRGSLMLSRQAPKCARGAPDRQPFAGLQHCASTTRRKPDGAPSQGAGPTWTRWSDGHLGPVCKLVRLCRWACRTSLFGRRGRAVSARDRRGIKLLAKISKKHGVDPVDSSAPRILTQNELKDFREPLDKLIFSAQEEIDQLYTVVREAGYAALFCDSAGVAVEHRGENARASQFAYWGAWLGGVWSEVAEGTNGIGTCIVEERPITIHKNQHFRSRHINLSCSGAPVFGVVDDW
jgi:hypothetical protein